MSVRVFVYGTLKPDEVDRVTFSDFPRSCFSLLVQSQPAIAYGNLYDLPLGYPAMVLGNASVHGFLLTFSNAKVLDLLDEYESEEYDRTWLEIFDSSQESLGFAWSYVMSPEQVDRAQGVLIPNGIWTSKNRPQSQTTDDS